MVVSNAFKLLLLRYAPLGVHSGRGNLSTASAVDPLGWVGDGEGGAGGLLAIGVRGCHTREAPVD